MVINLVSRTVQHLVQYSDSHLLMVMVIGLGYQRDHKLVYLMVIHSVKLMANKLVILMGYYLVQKMVRN